MVVFFDTSVLKENSLGKMISAEMQQNENKAAICGQVSPLFAASLKTFVFEQSTCVTEKRTKAPFPM